MKFIEENISGPRELNDSETAGSASLSASSRNFEKDGISSHSFSNGTPNNDIISNVLQKSNLTSTTTTFESHSAVQPIYQPEPKNSPSKSQHFPTSNRADQPHKDGIVHVNNGNHPISPVTSSSISMGESLITSSVRQKKRGIFPKVATNIMRAWLFQHLNVRVIVLFNFDFEC